MAWVAVNKNGREWIYGIKPIRHMTKTGGVWVLGKNNCEWYRGDLELPKGSLEKLIGRKLTWEDDPVELKEEEQ